jgi:hypothetical protein
MLHGLTMVSQYLTGNACFFPKGYPPMLEELLHRIIRRRIIDDNKFPIQKSLPPQ